MRAWAGRILERLITCAPIRRWRRCALCGRRGVHLHGAAWFCLPCVLRYFEARKAAQDRRGHWCATCDQAGRPAFVADGADCACNR